MAKVNFIDTFIKEARANTEGIVAITVVELSSGMTLGSYTDGTLDPDIASAYNVEVVKAKLKAVDALGLSDAIEDILITLSSQYHLINCTDNGTHMIYMAADKGKSNLAILRNIAKKGKEDIQAKL